MSSPLDYLTAHEPLFRPTRLPSLYSDLSVQKSSNPEGYAANVTAWTSALTRLTLAGQLPPEQNLLILQTGEGLLDALSSAKYGRPSGLGCVLDEGVRAGKVVEVKDFLGAEKSIYSRSWVPSPWAVLRWGLRQAGVSWGSGSYDVDGGRLRTGKLVLVPALEEVWKRLQPGIEGRGQGLTDRVLSRDAFAREISTLLARGESEGTKSVPSISESDLQVLLRYLFRDKSALAYDQTTIKFKSPTSTTPEPITQEDRSIASLKSLIQSLQQQTTSLSTRISNLQLQASTAVENKNKTSALSALRSKKLAEKTLQTRLDTLSQLEDIYAKIEAAVSQVEILAVMESSASTLKSLNKKIGGVERVEDVLDSLREEVGKVDEVSGVLGEVGAVDQKAVLDEGEVDDELEAMEREEREKTRKVEEEATRKRLQELDALEAIRKEQQREKEREHERQDKERQLQSQDFHAEKQADKDQELEDALSSSMEKLRKLDVDDLRREGDAADRVRAGARQGQEQGDPQRQTSDQAQREPVAQEAS
ncbi:hypothetical protein H2200_011107 [Cladophialophora chaetospira]|uniref:SNF7 family protein n=1 Tax=Cladophialophora chaetospira TaxID=386627 RepID=A0AA38X025_9EURO|nr:hypothetical protein H2200_011107 [Cladophialophora chaetospira]